MANRYWINNVGNWNDVLHWSASSGGVGNASIPTSGDSVFFDNQSFSVTSVITIDNTANCLDMTWSGITQNVTFQNAVYNLNVYGSLYLCSGLTWTFTSTAYCNLIGAGIFNITTNGVVPIVSQFNMNNQLGTWIHQDNFKLIGTVQLLWGNWNLNSKYIDLSKHHLNIESGGVRSITFGSGTLDVKYAGVYINSFTVNYDTGTYIIRGDSSAMTTIGNFGTLYNVRLINSSGSTDPFLITANLIVVNNFSIEGFSIYNRILLTSNAIGTIRTITAPNITASHVDFRDISIPLYLASNWNLSGITGGAGDCGGNLNITFTPSQTQYYKHTSGACNWSDNKWYSDYSRTILGRVPLPQDDAIFDELSFTGVSMLTVNVSRICRSLDMSGVNQNVTYSLINMIEVYGDYTLGDNITYSGNFYTTMFGRNDYTLNTYNKLIYGVLLYAPYGKVTNFSNLTCLASITIANQCTFDHNDFDISCQYYQNSLAGLGGIVYLGNGTLTVRSESTQLLIFDSTTYCEGSTIKVVYNGVYSLSTRFIRGNDITLNTVQISAPMNSNIDFYSTMTINHLIIDPNNRIRFTEGTTTTIGKLTAIGAPTSGITISSVTSGQTHNLIITGTTNIKYADISYSNVTPNTIAENSTGVDNTGWIFPENRYWIGNSGNWYDPSHWSNISGGISGTSLGTEIISNNTFDTTDYWILYANWNIANGKLNCNTDILNYASYTSVYIITGKTYQLSFEITDYTSGSVGAQIGLDSIGFYSAIGIYTGTTTSTTWNTLYFSAINFIGSIDNVSLREIITIPLTTSNVIFDSNSFNTTSVVTIDNTANCLSMDWTGIDQNVTLSSSVFSLNVYGNLTLFNGLIWNFTGTAYVYLCGVSNFNITTNGIVPRLNILYFNSTGGTWINQDDFSTLSTTIYLVDGTWNTNNKTIILSGDFYPEVGLGTKTLTLGSSLFQCSSFNSYYYSTTLNLRNVNFILNCGTSTIKCTSTFNGSTFDQPYYDIITSNSTHGSDQIYRNFTQINNTLSDQSFLIANYTKSNTITVTGLLTIKGTDSIIRIFVTCGYSYQKSCTINANSIDFENIDIRNIIGAGSANWDLTNITGGAGNCLRNSGITFLPGMTLYFKYTSGEADTKDIINWVTSSGGNIQGRVPLPQDDTIFDENSFTGSSTVYFSKIRPCRSINMSGVTQNVILAAKGFSLFGDFILGQNITHINLGLTIASDSDTYINTYGNPVNTFSPFSPVNYTLLNDFTILNDYTMGGYHKFYANGFNVNLGSLINHSGSEVHAGTGTWTFNGNTYSGTYAGPDTIIADSATIIYDYPSSIVDDIQIRLGFNANKVILKGSFIGEYNVIITGSLNILEIFPGIKVNFTFGSTTTINSLISLGKPGSLISIGSITPNSAYTLNLTSTDNLIDYTSFQDCTFTTQRSVGVNSINVSNNTNLDFTTPIHRYWIGNTGNFNDNAHWSLQSSGISNTIAPTSTENVIFDRYSFTSGATITLNSDSNCLTMYWSDITKNVSLISSVYNLNVYGSLTLQTGLTWNFTGTAYLYMLANNSRNIITNGVNPSMNQLFYNNVSGTWTNQDDFIQSGNIIVNLYGGTWNTNNKNINVYGIGFNSIVGEKTITCGSSNIYCNSFTITWINTPTLTFNCDTSKIILKDALTNSFYGGGRIFYNLDILGGGSNDCQFANETFNNVNLTPTTRAQIIAMTLNATINGMLNMIGVDALRVFIYSSVVGTQRSLIVNNIGYVVNADFRDIYLSGSTIFDLSGITGGSGDCGGNSGITFTPSQTQYYKSTSGTTNWSDNKWYSDYERTILGRVPLPQDDAIFDDFSFTGTSTLNIDVSRICRNLDMSSINQNVTIIRMNNYEVYGSFILSSNISITMNGFVTFLLGVGTNYINLNGVEINGYLYIFRGDYICLSDIDLNSFTSNYAQFQMGAASIDFNGFNFSGLNFGTAIGSPINIITFGTGNINLIGNVSYNSKIAFSRNSIITPGTYTINMINNYSPSDTSTISSGKLNKIRITGSGTKSCDIGIGIYTINVDELVIDAGKIVKFISGANTTINSLTAIGTSTSGITIGSITSGSTHYLVQSGTGIIDVQYATISDSNASPSLYAKRSIDGGNNTGWIFIEDRYWVGNSGNWNDISHWSTSSGGISGATLPTSISDVYFDANSFSTGSTITLNADANCLTMNWTEIDQNVTFSSAVYSINIYGSFILNSGLTWTFTATAYVNMNGSSNFNMTYNGCAPSCQLIFNNTGGTWNNQDDFTSTGAANIILNAGTWNTNNKNIGTLSNPFYSIGSTLDSRNKTLSLGSSIIYTRSWTITWSNTPNLTFNSNISDIILSTNGSAFYGGGRYFYDVEIYGTNTSGDIQIINEHFNNLTLNLFTTSTVSIYGNPIVYNNLTINGRDIITNRLMLISNNVNTQRTITVDPLKVIASNCDFQDIMFSSLTDLSSIPGGSGDCGGNSNIIFTPAVTQYYKSTSGATNWSDNKWYSDYERTTLGRVPLLQDDAIFDANSFTDVSTLFLDYRLCRNLDMSGVTYNVLIAGSHQVYGSYVLSNYISITGNVSLLGRGDHIFNSFGKTTGKQLNFVSGGGTYTNMSDINCSVIIMSNLATFDANDYNINCKIVSYGTGSAYTIYMGNGTWTVSDTWIITGGIYCENSTLTFSPTTGTTSKFYSLGKTYNNIVADGYSGTLDIFYNTTINNLIINSGCNIRFGSGTTTTINSISAVGTIDSGITITSIDSTSSHNLIKTGTGEINVKYATISYSNASPEFITRRSVDAGNNTGWTFPPEKYWIGNTGNWNDLSHWSDTSGGVAITEILGPERVTNGGFDSATSWSTTANVNISGGTCNFVNANNPNGVYQNGIIPFGKPYKCTFEIKNYVSGSVSITDGQKNYSSAYTGNGTYSSIFSSYSNSLYLMAQSLSILSIDNISLKEVTNFVSSGTTVYFDNNSFSGTSTVTLNSNINCLDMDWSEINNNVTLLLSASYNIYIYGSLLMKTGLTWLLSNTTNSMNFMSTTIGNFIYTDGVHFGGVAHTSAYLIFTGVGTWINLDDMFMEYSMGNVAITNGTWNTNDKTITLGGTLQGVGGSLIFGNSTINTKNGFTFTYVSLSAGTSTIICSGDWGSASDHTFYNVIVNEAGRNFGGTYGKFICKNLNRICANNTLSAMPLSGDIIVTDTFTVNGYSEYTRTIIGSAAIGTQFKITASNVVASNVDFRDIYLSGSTIFDLSSIPGGSGDCGGNSGITFTPSQTQYYKSTSGATIWSDDKWYSDYSPRTILGRLPLPQDDAIFDELSFIGTSTITLNRARLCKSLNMENISVILNINYTLSYYYNSVASQEIYGSLILSNNIGTMSFPVYTLLIGTGTNFIKTYSKDNPILRIDRINSTYIFIGDFKGTFTNRGNLYANGYTLTQVNPQWIYLYDGTFYLDAGTLIFSGGGSNDGTGKLIAGIGNFDCGTGTVIINDVGLLINSYNLELPSNRTYNKVIINNNYAGVLSITGSNVINELIIRAGCKIKLTEGTNQNITRLISLGSTSSHITIGSVTSGLTHTLSSSPNDWLVDYCDISDSSTIPNKFAGINSMNVLNNTGWDFSTQDIRYWVGDSGNYNDAQHWSLQSNGVSGATIPTLNESVVFDSYSFTITGQTITLDNTSYASSMYWYNTKSDITILSTNNDLYIYGSLYLVSGMTWNMTNSSLYFKSSYSDNAITTNDTQLNFTNIYFDNLTGYWKNTDNFTTSATIHHSNGTWNTLNKTITVSNYLLEPGTKQLILGNSTFNTINFNISTNYLNYIINSDTSKIISTSNAGSGISGVTMKSQTLFNVDCNDFYCESPTLHNLKISGNTYSNWIVIGTPTITGILTINGYNSTTNRFLLSSDILREQRTIDATTVSMSNIDILDINGTNWDLSSILGGSGDAGGNSNIIFTTIQNQTWNQGSGNWSDITKWSNRVPLLQDTAIFDANSFSGTSILTIDMSRISSINMNNINQLVTINNINSYGNIYLNSFVTINILNLFGRSSSLSLSGSSINSVIINGNYTNLSYLKVNSILFINGTFSLGDNIVEVNNWTAQSGILNANLSTIKFNSTGITDFTFNGGNFIYYDLWLSGNHTGYYDIFGNNMFNEIKIDAGRKIRFQSSSTQTIYSLSANGTINSGITISSTSNSQHYLIVTQNKSFYIFNYLNVSYSNVLPLDKFYATDSINSGNNTGWIFSESPVYIIVQDNTEILVDDIGRILF